MDNHMDGLKRKWLQVTAPMAALGSLPFSAK
jgi:hypothetical protein